jgi:hypothetical protein
MSAGCLTYASFSMKGAEAILLFIGFSSITLSRKQLRGCEIRTLAAYDVEVHLTRKGTP